MNDPKRVAAVGLFLILGLSSLGLLAIKMSDMTVFGDGRYQLQARFISASGLHHGATVELAGVRVGQVTDITLDPERYQATVAMRINRGVSIQADAIASIRTSGIIGDKFVKISPGGSEVFLGPGEEIIDTESSINLEELISKYIFEGGGHSQPRPGR